MAIKILPARLANQIAAGEVVERPSSVVKELVENSIDAGATNIHIQLERGGSKLISIRDNGSGIAKDDLTLALSRHATSKIHSVEDLENIVSLGFRGEALASISSVSRLKLTSKPSEQNEAWLAYAEGRDMEVTVEPAAHPDGTTIEVSDLFFNTPARRKFLRTDKTEFHHIDEMLKRIALSRFDVAFHLEHNGKTVRRLRVCTTPEQREQRVAQLCSREFMQNALQVSANHHGIYLSGWIAHPDSCKQQNDIQYSFVNGRMMRDKLLNHAIRQAYNEFIPDECHPAFILYLTLDAHQVDVNVHPAKHEVRFHQARLVHDFVVQAIESAFAQLQQRYQAAIFNENEPPISEHIPDNAVHENTAAYGISPVNPQQHHPEQEESAEFSLQPDTQSYSPTHTATTHSAAFSATSDREHRPSTAPYPGQSSQLQFSRGSYNHTNYGHDKPSSKQLKHYDKSLQQFAEHSSLVEQSAYVPQQMSEQPVLSEHIASVPPVVVEKKAPHFDGCKIVAVLKGSLAIATFNDELWRIDLNRLEAQQLQQQAEQGGLKAQPLLLPVRIALRDENDHTQLNLLSSSLLILGIEIQSFAQHLIVKKVPAFIRKTDVTSWFDTLLNIDLSTVEPEQILAILLNKMLAHREAQSFNLEIAATMLQRALIPQNTDGEKAHVNIQNFLQQHATKIDLTT